MTIRLKAQSKNKHVVLKQMDSLKSKHGLAFERGNKKVAYFLLEESRKIVPIDEGDLHDSSRVVGKGRGFKNEQSVEYRMPYALRQHEDLTYKHAPGKSAQYLEKPMRRFKTRMAQIMKDEMQKVKKK